MKTLLPALNAAAEVMRQAAVSEAAVLQAVAEQLARLGLRGGVSLLDETGALSVRAAAFPGSVLAALEELTGLKPIGYSFSPTQVDAYRQALETGQAVFVPDGSTVVAQLIPESARHFLELIIRWLGREPAIIAPLIAEGKRLGALSAAGPDLTPEDALTIMALADHIAIALANARLREREAQHLRRLSAFSTIALALNNSTELTEALRLTLRETLAALDLPAGWISLRETAKDETLGDRFWLAAHQNLPPALTADDHAAMRRQPCNCQRQLLAGKLPAAVNILECERLLEWANGDTRGLCVHAAIPIRSGDQILGMLNLALPPGRTSFEEDDLTMLSALGHQLGVTLTRARLHAETLESLRREQRLNEIARLIAGTLDEATLLQRIVRLTAELIGAEVGALALVARDGQTITYPYLYNMPKGLALEPAPKGQGIAWHIVETGQTVLLDDYADHPNALPNWVEAGVRAFVGVPVVAGEERLGALGLFNIDPAKRFSARDAALVESVGRQAGVAIQNARLFKAKQWRVDALTALHATGLDLSRGDPAGHPYDLPSLLRTITERAARLLKAPMGGLYLLVEEDSAPREAEGNAFGQHAFGYLELVVSHNLSRDYTGTRLRLGEGLSGRIAQTGEPLIVDNYNEWAGRMSVYADEPLAGVVGAPIKWQGKVIGVINVADTRPGRFHVEDAEMLTLFADQAAVAIANARLYERLESREAYFRALIENAWDGVMILDNQRRLRYVSPSVERILGYRPAELLDRDIFELVHPDDTALASHALQEIVTSSLVSTIEARLRHRDGSWHCLEATGRNLLHDPHVAGVLINFRDITERKQAEANLRHRTAELENLERVASALRTASTRAEMLPEILDQVLNVLNADGAALAMHDPATNGAVIEMARGSWATSTGIRLAPGEGISSHVIATGKPYLTDDIYADPRMTHRDLIHGLRAVACVPLIAHQQILGALWVGRASGRRSGTNTLAPNPGFSEAEVHLLTAIADITANALRRETLHEQTQRLAADLAQAYDATLEGWARALELRDEATKGHTRRVTEMAVELARAMGMNEEELIRLRRGALLHDIGKMGIPDSILLKPDKLTDEEWKIMRQHPTYAHDMLEPIAYLRPALDIPYCHHEKWDGTGYPRGLKGEEIPLGARIFAVVDVWDALTSDRPYRPALPEEQALAYIREQSGKHFDPQVVEMFLKIRSELLKKKGVSSQ
ncbi:MAG: GAF domain-containing protein [Anaerolineales bacterium]|nr:GAF domain-containing protein [Anaerolineales bacterium]